MFIFGENLARKGKEDLAMKTRRFFMEQIFGILKWAELGVPVAELIRKVGIGE
jgi:hypothetical protein